MGAYTATYSTTDLGSMAIDFVGGILGQFAANGTQIGTILVITIIVLLLFDLVTGILGFVNFLKGFGKQ